MLQLLENKQTIHIVSEIIILLLILFYFSQKNNKLMGYIEDLAQKLEEHEDIIKRQEQIIQHLLAQQPVRSQNHVAQPSVQKVNVQPVDYKQSNRKNKNKNKNKSLLVSKQTENQKAKVVEIVENESENENENESENENENESESENESDNSCDLDAELAEELNDLDEQNVIDKKKAD